MISIVICIFLSFANPLSAKIWVRNGNFSLNFYDVNESGGLEIFRYYNSVGFTKGMFGYGWGCPLEVRLLKVAGVMVMIEEIPGGGRSHFIPKKKKAMGVVVDKIIEAAKLEGHSPAFYKRLKKKLLENVVLLVEFAKRYKLHGRPPAGTVLYGLERSDEKIKILRSGYIRYRNDGTVDEFDNVGQIVKLTLPRGGGLRFSYSPQGRLSSIRDKLGRWMKFYINDKGLLEKMVLYNDKVATYRYDKRDDLIESRDISGKLYRYKYNSYHKMIEFIEPPRQEGGKPRKWFMKYDDDTGRIVYQKTADGWETYIEYSSDKIKDEFYEAVNVVRRFGNEVASEKYEFWKRPKPDGSLYTYKIRERKGTKEKTVTYTMCCATPLVIDKDGKITRFEYNKKGKIRKKVFPDGRILDVKYDKKDRISYIINDGTPYRFKYNDKGQMIFAGTKLIKFKMSYDRNGRVAGIRDNRKNAFSLKYDRSGRLRELVSKYGSLIISYDKSGEPRVTSKGQIKEKIWKIRRVYQDYIDLMMVFSMLESI